MNKEIAFLVFAAFRDSLDRLVYDNAQIPLFDKAQAAIKFQATFTSMLTKESLFLWEEYLELSGK